MMQKTAHNGAARAETLPLGKLRWDPGDDVRFGDDDVPDEDLEAMFALASQAPSTGNLQPWRFVLVRDPGTRRALCRAAGNPAAADAPVLVAAFGRRRDWQDSFDEILDTAAERGEIAQADAARRKAEVLGFVSSMPTELWIHRNVMIAFTYLLISAAALGWDAVPMERFDPVVVREALDLPDDADVVALLSIGRLKRARAWFSSRLARQRLVYSEKFGAAWEDPMAGDADVLPGFAARRSV
jgi:nitroreductase